MDATRLHDRNRRLRFFPAYSGTLAQGIATGTGPKPTTKPCPTIDFVGHQSLHPLEPSLSDRPGTIIDGGFPLLIRLGCLPPIGYRLAKPTTIRFRRSGSTMFTIV